MAVNLISSNDISVQQTGSDISLDFTQNAVANKNVYSTSETRVGTWIDGKPLYRKVISGTTTGETNNILNIITGYDEVIKYNGTFKTPSGYITELPEYTNSTNYIYFVLNTANNVGILTIPSGFIGGIYKIIIEYTKTTD